MARLLAFSVLLLSSLGAEETDAIEGDWRGTFNAMPHPGDLRMRERQYRFELKLSNTGAGVSGTFRNLTALTPVVRITRGECRNGLCCFEVVDDPAEAPDVNTWCVSTKGRVLEGTRNGGEMTALGIGSGARLFRVTARRSTHGTGRGLPRK